MQVKGIKLINFRNYKSLNIKLNDKLNIFLGNNAQGKTNLLESIYLCAIGRSYRTSRDKELINFERDAGYIAIEIEMENFNRTIEVKLEREKPKRIRINGIEVDKISDLFGLFNVVIFSPEDLRLVKEGPSERRLFLDTEISQIKPKYRYNLSRYNKVLQQRNNLLKIIQNDQNKIKVLDVWDIQLAALGAEIMKGRIDFLEKVSNISKDIHKKITGGLEELVLDYIPSFEINHNSTKEQIKDAFLEELKNKSQSDIDRGTTEVGPHRDDIGIIINGVDSRTFGSQGQQRTAALSLKLAEVEIINMEVGEYPVLLLDDVLSELDFKRRSFLISTFKNIQTIITSTDDIDLKDIQGMKKKVFHIKEGRIIQ